MKNDIQNRDDIKKIVIAFHEKLWEDKGMKHIFFEVAEIDVLGHFDTMINFWERALFQTKKYNNNTLDVHLELHFKHHLKVEYFTKWFEEFTGTVDEMFEGERADEMKEKARSMATVIKMKIDDLEKKRLELNNLNGKSRSHSVGKIVSKTQVFKGSEGNPLLAPRGVFLVKNKLFVADTAQNRVFIWNELPDGEFADPDVVLGQAKKENTGRNADGAASASTLFYPSGVWSDGEKLIVADAWNHRVLIWNNLPTEDGQPADVVVGQKDFLNNQPNIDGVGSTPSAHSLNWPYGVFSDGEKLWIADTGNRRILYFEKIPTQNYAPADKVIGKPDFNERDYENTDPIWPYSVKINSDGKMAVADTQYYRILLWENWESAFEKKADAIIGQDSFEGNGQNQFGWFPKENTLNWCYDTCFYKDGIFVADTGNSRILWFENMPSENNASANNLLGQDNFTTGSENKNTIWTTEDSLYWPFQVCIEGSTMVAADTGNHRVVINHLKF